ncbi:hypothetical protein BFP97_08895 [Roseivirga sp. 4D4]|uniref:glycosyltransferase family 4 protein n=1 Tax=Roseivirga sp. 4D4 TaxID=1889784 RepID=UPI0008536544|nr:glycosyltransferase family 4 protein [Roseivirga sp. 4D4]OEK01623.1 hypothetical protein BFP97_08895 [Roseivirga sp. 4D4]
MKILFVQKEGGIFGAENYQLKVIPGLQAKGIQIEFLRLYTDYQGGVDGLFIEKLKELNVNTHQVNIGRYPKLRALRYIKKVVDNGDFDIVHTHLIHADFHLALIKTLLGLKVCLVSTKHGYDNSFTSRHGFDATKQRMTPYFVISKWAERRMKSSFTISHGLLNFFNETGLTRKGKMKLIHYGFDLEDHFLRKGEQEYRLSSKQLIIAGRLVAFKGHNYLLSAMTLVRERFGDDVKLLVAGTGALESELRAKVKELGLIRNVEFLGYSKEVGAYMANSDVVIVPSISEGFGVVFLEAFASKTPVISWDVPAGNELMQHNETGYLVPPYEISLLADQIIDVLENLESQGPITEGAYLKLTSYFNLSRMTEETIMFYKTAIEE